ncbi:hypothetical protein DPMN_191908 [Dreissena polymorpha]|uniref:Uncharacterized protein n=1 Tax=Dreissena polymorpha TaxID=45954 RepID=A0A9D4BDU3_DREPO|nr:hypothetical protein DPMN_191908 [Dreissena polymorpha]
MLIPILLLPSSAGVHMLYQEEEAYSKQESLTRYIKYVCKMLLAGFLNTQFHARYILCSRRLGTGCLSISVKNYQSIAVCSFFWKKWAIKKHKWFPNHETFSTERDLIN